MVYYDTDHILYYYYSMSWYTMILLALSNMLYHGLAAPQDGDSPALSGTRSHGPGLLVTTSVTCYWYFSYSYY